MRKLTLKKETVAELSSHELGEVVGAAPNTFTHTYKICLPTHDACFTTHGCG